MFQYLKTLKNGGESLVLSIQNIGINPNTELSETEISEIQHSNLGVVISYLSSAFSIAFFAQYIPFHYLIFPIICAHLYLVAFILNYLNYHVWARTTIWIVSNVVFFWLSSAYGYESNAHLLFIIAALITFFNNNHQKGATLWAHSLVPFSCIIILFLTDFSLFKIPNISPQIIHKVGIFLFFLTLAMTVLGMFFFRKEVANHAKFLANSEAEVQRKYEELKKTNEELDRFVYSVSHDLRSPITSMMGLVSLMRSDEKMWLYYLGLQEQSLKKLDNFICDILTYSRNTRLQVEIKEIPLRALVENCFQTHKPYDCDMLELKLDIPENLRICSDEYRLTIIFNNLISNAIRYRKKNIQNPYIEIAIVEQDDKWLLTIKDNGIGIEEKYQKRVFEMFFRAHTQEVGSGLGLYIVKEAIDKLKGKVNLFSQHNVGTTFTIELPLLAQNDKTGELLMTSEYAQLAVSN